MQKFKPFIWFQGNAEEAMMPMVEPDTRDLCDVGPIDLSLDKLWIRT